MSLNCINSIGMPQQSLYPILEPQDASTGFYPDMGYFPSEVSMQVANSPLHNYDFSPGNINLGKKSVNLLSKIGGLFKKTSDREDIKKHYENMFEFVCNSFNSFDIPETNFDKFNLNSHFQLFYKLYISQLLMSFLSTTSSWPLSERVELLEACLKKCDEKIPNSNKESLKAFLKYDFFLMLIIDRSNQYQSIQTPKEKEEFRKNTVAFFVGIHRLFPQGKTLAQYKEFDNAICHLGYWGRLNLLQPNDAFHCAKAVENLHLHVDYLQTPMAARAVDAYFAQMHQPIQPLVQPIPIIMPSAPPMYEEPIMEHMPIQPQIEQAPVIAQQVKSEVFVDDESKTDFPFDRERKSVQFKVESEHIFSLADDLPWLKQLSLVDRFALLHNIQFPNVGGVAEDIAYSNLWKRSQTKYIKEKYGNVDKWIESLLSEVKSAIIQQRHELKHWGYSIVSGEISKRSEEGINAEIRMWVDRAVQKGAIIDINAFYRMAWKKGGRINNGDLDWGKNHAADGHELFSKSFTYFVEKGYLS